MASQIEARLRSLGNETFIDINDIAKGDDIEQRIFEELSQCDELVALFTPWAVDRKWECVKIGAARALGLRIVTVLYAIDMNAIDGDKGGATFLRAKNYLDINELKSYFSELAARCGVKSDEST
ncbi:MAG TPA: toll/interleukin-1 receptor domain-containing protein [Rhizobiaceae bacterium]|nr:toll/interleukin-1 receptor domain-containing protein [Rhizobiaceae bacterium]